MRRRGQGTPRRAAEVIDRADTQGPGRPMAHLLITQIMTVFAPRDIGQAACCGDTGPANAFICKPSQLVRSD